MAGRRSPVTARCRPNSSIRSASPRPDAKISRSRRRDFTTRPTISRARPEMEPPPDSSPGADDAPHYLGHRDRLRDRFRNGGGSALADYELLELVLFRAIPRRDVKPLAKSLLARFGSFAAVVSARPERLREIAGLGEAAIVELKIVAEAAKRFAKVKVENRPAMGSFSAVL